MVSSAIWKKHTRFEVFEKLTSVCFFKLHEKPYYYLLIICMKKVNLYIHLFTVIGMRIIIKANTK